MPPKTTELIDPRTLGVKPVRSFTMVTAATRPNDGTKTGSSQEGIAVTLAVRPGRPQHGPTQLRGQRSPAEGHQPLSFESPEGFQHMASMAGKDVIVQTDSNRWLRGHLSTLDPSGGLILSRAIELKIMDVAHEAAEAATQLSSNAVGHESGGPRIGANSVRTIDGVQEIPLGTVGLPGNSVMFFAEIESRGDPVDSPGSVSSPLDSPLNPPPQ